MPRPLRTVKPPSAPAATVKKPTTAKVGTVKSRTTRSGTKDIASTESGTQLPLPTPSSDGLSKKSSPTKKSTAASIKAIVTKRSTRSKAPTIATTTTTEETAQTPKPRTTRRKPAAKEPEPVLEQEPEVESEQTTEEPEPLLPTTVPSPLRPSSPEIQVPASSNAENHTPSPQFRSSPPPMPSTPPLQTTVKRRIVLEFDSDAGYSPPPARPTSAERPRLRELQPVSLEPLDPTESEADEENANPRASPTPKRGRKSGFVPVQEERGGRPSAFYIPGVDGEEAFTIYSDPKSPTPPTLPRNTTLDDIMRPPESSPDATPVKMRKRRSSGAVIDSDDDVAGQDDAEDETEKAADRKGKRRKAIGKVRLMTTADLRDLLPRRKKNAKTGEKDEYDVISTSEDAVESEDDSSDELSRPTGARTTRSGRAGTKKAAAKVKATKTAKTGKKTTTKSRNARTSTAPKIPSSTRVSKTYARKSFSSEKENDSPTKSRNQNRGDSAVDVAGPSSSGDETVVPDAGGKSGRRKLREIVDKFKEVDRWEMEFEDVSPRSLEAESESGR